MATSALIPVSEYLTTCYRPDCDYVDGEVQERNLGERDHAALQTRIANLLCSERNEQFVTALTELRVQVTPTRFRVPDVCVLPLDAPWEQIVQHPPLVCVEVLSPEDTMLRTRERVRDFLQMGVLEVWVVDAKTRSVIVYRGDDSHEVLDGELKVPGTPVVLRIQEIFRVLQRP